MVCLIWAFSLPYSLWFTMPLPLSKPLRCPLSTPPFSFSSIPWFSCSSDLALLLVLNKVSWRIIRSAKCSKATNHMALAWEQTAAAPVICPLFSLKGLLWAPSSKTSMCRVYDVVRILDLCICKWLLNFYKRLRLNTKSQRSHSGKCVVQQILWQPLKAAMSEQNTHPSSPHQPLLSKS